MAGILEDFFGHNTIELYTGVFGDVFNNIKIMRKNDKFIKVPIAYSVKQKYDDRNHQNPDPNAARVKMSLPRMSFTLMSFQRDPSRVLNRMDQLVADVDRKTANGVSTQRNRVPYNFQYQLNIKTKNIGDMLQIMEQILPYFNPSIVVNVIDNSDLGLQTAIPIRLLNNDAMGDMFEGLFEEEQVLEATLDFELEGYLYMPTSSSGIIKQVEINYYDLSSKFLLDAQVFTEEDLP